MKGMRNLNKTNGKSGLSWIITLFVFGAVCIGIGFIAAANFNLLPASRASNVQTSSAPVTTGEGVDILFRTQESFRQIVTQAKPAVVTIETKKVASEMPFNVGPNDNWFFFDPFKRPDTTPSPKDNEKNFEITGGSGFFVSPDGYILTNNHVVSDAVEITVTTDDQETFKADLVGNDPMTDVALLKINGNQQFKYLELGNSENAQIGDWVIAIGSPIRLAQTVTVGIISGKNREDVKIGDIDYSNFIQTDAAINFGNSGGPLLDIYGKVIGINTAIAGGANVTGIGFAIPSDLAKFAYDNLKAHGEVVRAWIGVTIQQVDADLAKVYGLQKPTGAIVNSMVKDDPADKAGLKLGDLILEIDGAEVTSPASLSRIIAEKAIGKPLDLTVMRDGKTMHFNVTPSLRPKDAQAKVNNNPVKPEVESPIGINVSPLTPEIRKEIGLPDEITGVIINNVKKNSTAAEKMLFMYDIVSEIDHQPISNISDYEKAMAKANKVALFKVYRQNLTGGGWTSLYVAIPLE
jgi:serine protease Do